MITAWELYLWTRLDSIGVAFEIFATVSVFGAFGSLVIGYGESFFGKAKKFAYLFIALLLFCVFGAVATPTTKEAAMIWVIPQLATIENAELLKGEAAEIYKLAKQALTESITTTEGE